MQIIRNIPNELEDHLNSYALRELYQKSKEAQLITQTISSEKSATVILSDDALERFNQETGSATTDRQSTEQKESILDQKMQEAEEGGGPSAATANEAIAETMKELERLLREAVKRLAEAQRQMNEAIAEMQSAGDEEKMAAMEKVTALQAQVASAQGEVLVIQSQINKILEEQLKSS